MRAIPLSQAVEVAPSIEGQDGLLLAQIVNASTATSNAEDLGFQRITTASVPTAPTVVLHLFWKIAAGSAGEPTTEPASFTVTNSLGAPQDLLLFAVYGYDPAAPIQAFTMASGSAVDAIVPGITVARPGSLGLWWKAGYGSSTTATPDAWMVVVRGQDGVNDIAWQSFGVGPTGDVTSRQFSDSPWVSVFAVAQPR